MRTPALLILLGACTATPTSPTGSTPSDSGSHSAVEWGHSDAATTHSAYVVPDLPPPTPGPLVLESVGQGTGGYVLEHVFAGPEEWDRFVAEELATGCPHYLDDPPCGPLRDAATLGITDTSSWLVFGPDRWGNGFVLEGAEVTEDGSIEVRWRNCGFGDQLLLAAWLFRIPRAAYTGVVRITESPSECP